ncbi:hypothetical protein RRG08_018039 [Elysia crispata]|uniref:Uncharacterized protein n=1 Tax=Elysia crispata TaxID=231223 RepID=A0AAE0ZCY4_9GAST|nr:hypothetical protein RRG08_018039 [Elysia crispata]
MLVCKTPALPVAVGKQPAVPKIFHRLSGHGLHRGLMNPILPPVCANQSWIRKTKPASCYDYYLEAGRAARVYVSLHSTPTDDRADEESALTYQRAFTYSRNPQIKFPSVFTTPCEHPQTWVLLAQTAQLATDPFIVTIPARPYVFTFIFPYLTSPGEPPRVAQLSPAPAFICPVGFEGREKERNIDVVEDSRLEGSEGTRKLVQILMRKSDTEGTVLEDGERNSQATEVLVPIDGRATQQSRGAWSGHAETGRDSVQIRMIFGVRPGPDVTNLYSVLLQRAALSTSTAQSLIKCLSKRQSQL